MTKGILGLAKNLGGMISRNSPTILTGLSVGGLLTTVILAVNATPKAVRLLEEYKEDMCDGCMSSSLGDDSCKDCTYGPLKKKEVVKVTWKCYIPAAAVGLATIFCVIGANHISLRRNAALAGLYGITEAAFKEYQAKVVETIGKNKELAVRDEISADKVAANPPSKSEIIFTGKGDVLCYDSMSGRYFKSDIEKIRRIVNEFNHELIGSSYLSLNEFYYMLGLSGIELGNDMGWNTDKLLDVTFSCQLTDEQEPCLVVNYSVNPRWMGR